MITNKYTEQELREAWRIILNSPNLCDYWKEYDRLFNNKALFPNWDLLTDGYALSCVISTLDEFRIRESKKGTRGACVLWGRELKTALGILKEKAVPYYDYVKTRSESEISFERLSELGGLSKEEIEVLQKAGVLKVGEESQDYYNISELLYKAEIFDAYCEGLLRQINKNRNTPVEIADWKKNHGFQIDSEGFILFDGTPRKFLEKYGNENWLPDIRTLSLNVKTLYGKEYTLKSIDSWNKARKPPRKRKK